MKDQKVTEGEKQFTASVWILSSGIPRKLLLILHKKLGKWMQPGGHMEQFENPVEAAIREVKEETGLDIGFLAGQIKKSGNDASFLPIPRFIMEQEIPPHGSEPKHYHIDINYVVEVSEQEFKQNSRETDGIGWFTKEEIKNLPTHSDTKEVVKELLK